MERFIGAFTAVALQDKRVWVEWHKRDQELRGTVAGFKELQRVSVSTYQNVEELELHATSEAERLGAECASALLLEIRGIL